jgi:hypothetical protein
MVQHSSTHRCDGCGPSVVLTGVLDMVHHSGTQRCDMVHHSGTQRCDMVHHNGTHRCDGYGSSTVLLTGVMEVVHQW